MKIKQYINVFNQAEQYQMSNFWYYCVYFKLKIDNIFYNLSKIMKLY